MNFTALFLIILAALAIYVILSGKSEAAWAALSGAGASVAPTARSSNTAGGGSVRYQ